MWNNLQDLPSEKKQDAAECTSSFAQKVWGASIHPHMFIYGSSLEGSSSAQTALGSAVSTLLWLFKNWSVLGDQHLLLKARSLRSWSALDGGGKSATTSVGNTQPHAGTSPLLRLLLPGSHFTEHRLILSYVRGLTNIPYSCLASDLYPLQ